ncbi:hypothetical protein [uncultured Hymenobacter sp.]|uniref:hypothetical protein n=1 Tax=uncultured Hymenobacter sp. TaxID=170016 RepID=UPI0035C9B897
MADQNQDMPLVVSEILIEMHGMNDRLTKVEAAINRMAEVILLQQQENNKRFEALMQADRANTEMLINAFRDEGVQTRNQLSLFNERLINIEQKLS